MRPIRHAVTSVMALLIALSGLAGGVANAAEGYHAAYFSESSFLSLAPGQTGQFAVGYGNTGDQPWVKGTPAQQTSLHTRNNSITLYSAGWAQNWVAPDIYANQTNDLVAPGQIGFFIYDIKVPQSAALGPQEFSGLEYIAGTPMEDYGYYQVVTVTSSTIAITGSSPASPSTTTTPTISGTGATPGVLVTVQEGTTTLCTATASVTGTFSCTVSVLGTGSHSITATGPNQGTSAVFTYVVDNAPPALSSIDTAQGLKRMNVCFNKPMSTSGSGSILNIGSYTLTGVTLGTTTGSGQAVNSIVASSDSRCALFILDSISLTNNNSYTLTVNNVRDTSGNVIAANSSLTFTATDATAPAGVTITQPGVGEIIVSFNEAMNPSTLIASNFKWDSTNFPGNFAVRGSGSGLNRQVRLTFTGAVATGTHALDIYNVTDTAGNVISPNPTTVSVVVGSDTTRPTVSSATASRNDYNLGSGGAGYIQTVRVNFSEAMKRTLDWGATNALDNVANYSLANPDGSAATTGCSSGSGTALTFSSSPPTAVGLLSDDDDARWELRGVRLTLNALMSSGCQYTLSVSNVQDQNGNAVNPNPTLITVSDVLDSSALVVQTATVGTSSLVVCYSKSMFASVTTSSFTSNTTASNTANYQLTGGGTTYTLTWSGNSGNNWNVSADGRCITFAVTGTLASGTYSLTVTSVTDPAGNALSPNPTTISTTFSDTTAPTLTGASYISVNSFSVTFSKAMTGGVSPTNSAGNPTNYSLNNGTYGNICASGTAGITASSNNTVWTLECTGTGAYLSNVNYSSPAAGGTGAYIVQIRNVADQNGNVITPNPVARGY